MRSRRCAYSLPSDYDPALGESYTIVSTTKGLACIGLSRYDVSVLGNTAFLDTISGAWEWTDLLCSSKPMFNVAALQKDDSVYVWAMTATVLQLSKSGQFPQVGSFFFSAHLRISHIVSQ